MHLSAILILALFGPFVWAQDRLRELPDEQLRLQSALGIFYDGLLAEDRDVIRAFVCVHDDPQAVLTEAQVRRLIANMRFIKAVERFQIAHGDNPFERSGVFFADDFAFAMLAGEWKIEGERATMPPEERMGGPDQPPPPPVIKVRGVWKVDLTPSNVASIRELSADITRYAEVLEQTAADVNAGKLKSIDEVRQALEKAPQFAPAVYMPDLVLAPLAQKR